jgi:hypothetical protein
LDTDAVVYGGVAAGQQPSESGRTGVGVRNAMLIARERLDANDSPIRMIMSDL